MDVANINARTRAMDLHVPTIAPSNWGGKADELTDNLDIGADADMEPNLAWDPIKLLRLNKELSINDGEFTPNSSTLRQLSIRSRFGL